MCARCIYTQKSERRVRRQKKEGGQQRRSRFEKNLNLGQTLKLFCASVLKFRSTEVELFVLEESNYSVDFALQFGKVWDRIFVGREFL